MAQERDQWRVPVTKQRHRTSRYAARIFNSKEGLHWAKTVTQPKSAQFLTNRHDAALQAFSFVALTFTISEMVHVLDTEVRTTSLPIVLTEWVGGGGLFSRLVLMSAPRVCWSTSVRFQLNAHAYQRGFNHKRTDNTQHTIICFGGKQRGTP